MDKRTAEIIMVIKGNHNYPTTNRYEAVKQYMADKCECPLEAYTDYEMFRIIGETARDYNSTANDPHVFMYCFLDYIRLLYAEKPEIVKAVSWGLMSALSLTQVRNHKEYINGFSEELCEDIVAIHSPEWFKEELK